MTTYTGVPQRCELLDSGSGPWSMAFCRRLVIVLLGENPCGGSLATL